MRISKLLVLLFFPFNCYAQVPAPASGTYTLRDVSGVSTVWASHVPAESLGGKNISPYLLKVQNERTNMPAYVTPFQMNDGVGKLQQNYLSFRRGSDGQYEGLLKYGENTSLVNVINGSHSMSFIEFSDDAATTYTVHRNVRHKDGAYLVTVSATKSTGLYVCTWSFSGWASIDTK